MWTQRLSIHPSICLCLRRTPNIIQAWNTKHLIHAKMAWSGKRWWVLDVDTHRNYYYYLLIIIDLQRCACRWSAVLRWTLCHPTWTLKSSWEWSGYQEARSKWKWKWCAGVVPSKFIICCLHSFDFVCHSIATHTVPHSPIATCQCTIYSLHQCSTPNEYPVFAIRNMFDVYFRFLDYTQSLVFFSFCSLFFFIAMPLVRAEG